MARLHEPLSQLQQATLVSHDRRYYEIGNRRHLKKYVSSEKKCKDDPFSCLSSCLGIGVFMGISVHGTAEITISFLA
jgi:hypothetical protein